jgi:hypothetical protein
MLATKPSIFRISRTTTTTPHRSVELYLCLQPGTIFCTKIIAVTTTICYDRIQSLKFPAVFAITTDAALVRVTAAYFAFIIYALFT